MFELFQNAKEANFKNEIDFFRKFRSHIDGNKYENIYIFNISALRGEKKNTKNFSEVI